MVYVTNYAKPYSALLDFAFGRLIEELLLLVGLSYVG